MRDSSSALPVLGVVVTLTDSAGRSMARTISDERGQFSLPFPGGVARLRVMRIGLRPRELTIDRKPGETDVSFDIVMTRIPALLARVDVRDRALCPGSADRGSAFALWEQARAGLEATVVAREARPADVTFLGFDRTLSPSDDRVRSMTVKATSGRSARPFVAAAPASVFAERGYINEDDTGRTYHAPDADVLLDESFATTHCFRIVAADDRHAGQVGLEFKPASERDIVDVTGVLWLDREPLALRSMEFRYTGLEPIASTVRTGGMLSFRTMPNGLVLIDWWVLRFPQMAQIPRQPVMGIVPTNTPSRSTRNDLRVSAVHESGGELVAATWPEGASWKTEPARIRGRVVESGTATPRAGAVIILEGSNLETETKGDGRYAMAPVIPGRYMLSVSDTSLNDLTEARSVSRAVDVKRGDTLSVDFTVPPLAEVVPRACQGTKMRPESSILIGTLLDSAGNVIHDAMVTARWLDAADIIGNTLQAHHTERTYEVDDQGRFRFCGVVRERPVELRVKRPGLAVTADTTVFAYELMQRLVWRIRAPQR